MANIFKPKSRSIDATPPTTATLADGEIAVNSFSRRIFQRVGTEVIAIANYFSGAFADLSGKPDTLAGYGITDAQPLDGTLTALAGVVSAANRIPYFTGPDTASVLAFSTDGALAADSDTTISSQRAIKSYIDGHIAAADAMVFKGVIDCSANPNYPVADRGWTYRVSVAGKIGGNAGANVEVGDILICIADGTAAGDQAAVGAQWAVIQANIDGALTTANIGSTVQPYDAGLANLAGVTTAANKGIYATGVDVFATYDLSVGGRALANAAGTANTFPYFSAANVVTLQSITAQGRALLDDADAAAQRTTLALGTAATSAATDFAAAGHAHDFAILTNKPTTLAGYGITDATPSARAITAGNGLTGGGNLSADRTVALGTPSTLNGTTTNAVTATSHTHAVQMVAHPSDVASLPDTYPINPTVGTAGTGFPTSLGTVLTAQSAVTTRIFQLFAPNKGGTSSPDLYLRSHHTTDGGGGWTGFTKMWHSGNFDPAAKLDATGTAAAATKLATARTINGVAFDGTANITISAVADWGTITSKPTTFATSGMTLAASDVPTLNQNTTGSAATLTTARTLTVGSTGKTFNGSANVAWTLGEIGAAAAVHTHVIGDVTNLQSTLDGKVSIAQSGSVVDPNTLGGTLSHGIVTTPAGNGPTIYSTIWNLGSNGSKDGQFAWYYGAGTPQLFFRSRHDTTGNWNSWVTVHHSGNFDPTTKLNNVNPLVYGPMSFGSVTRQMLNLWGTTFGIGVQDSTLYYRAGAGVQSGHAWFFGGEHSDTRAAPGAGGVLGMYLHNTQLTVNVPIWAAGTNGGGVGAKLYVGDDAALWDVSLAHTIGIKSQGQPQYGYLTFGDQTTQFGWNGAYLCYGSGKVLHTGARPELDTVAHYHNDWNACLSNGWYMAPGAPNAPAEAGGSWLMGQVTQHNGAWIQQEVFIFTNGPNTARWRRHMNGGGWSSWIRVRESGFRVFVGADPGSAMETDDVWIT